MNQQVGIDPEFVYAWPQGSSLEKGTEPSPRRNTGTLEISLDGGKTWKHPASTATFNATDHKYTYEVTGDDNALQVRFVDQPYGDNSGRVRALPAARGLSRPPGDRPRGSRFFGTWGLLVPSGPGCTPWGASGAPHMTTVKVGSSKQW